MTSRIVPSRRTRDPDDIDITWKLGDYRFELPLLALAMDGVVSPTTAGIIGRLGGLGVLNLEGIFTRYEDADEQLERSPHCRRRSPRARCRRSTREPVKEELIAERIREIKARGSSSGRLADPAARAQLLRDSPSRPGSTSSSSRARSSPASTSRRRPSRSTSRSSSRRSTYPWSSAAAPPTTPGCT